MGAQDQARFYLALDRLRIPDGSNHGVPAAETDNADGSVEVHHADCQGNACVRDHWVQPAQGHRSAPASSSCPPPSTSAATSGASDTTPTESLAKTAWTTSPSISSF
ncbi:hypothetical protein ACP4OV_026999 [Aristida adscensionis]